MNEERIKALAQSIYLARHNQKNDVEGTDLDDFLDQTIEWVNQLTPEIEAKADWNFVRTNDDDSSLGRVTNASIISYSLPDSIRKIVINPHRDLTIRQDGTVVSSFELVNPNQVGDPSDHGTRDRATVLRRQIIFSRPLTDNEVGGTIVADTIARIPQLSLTDGDLLDIFDENPDIRQLYVMGVVKNQILPDIVQGGLTPSYAQKYDRYLQDCITENNLSSTSDFQDRESFAWIGMVG